MKARLRLPSRNVVFALLMVLSAALMVLPSRWTGGLKCARQVVAPFQDGMYVLTVGPSPGGDKPARISAKTYHELRTKLDAAQNQIISLNLLLRELEAERPTIGLILQKLSERSATRNGRIVPARVIAADPAAWRDTLLLDKGRSHGISDEQWVASRRLLDAGAKDGVRKGMVTLAREFLLGRIDELTPYSSRLVLLSDQDSREPVWIGRVEGESFRIVASHERLRDGKPWAEPGDEAAFLLVGDGQGKMIISGVHEDYVERDVIEVDDLVVSAGTSATLPIAMVVGHIVKIEDDPGHVQHRRLIVRCPVDEKRLRWVYIVDIPPRAKMLDVTQ